MQSAERKIINQGVRDNCSCFCSCGSDGFAKITELMCHKQQSLPDSLFFAQPAFDCQSKPATARSLQSPGLREQLPFLRNCSSLAAGSLHLHSNKAQRRHEAYPSLRYPFHLSALPTSSPGAHLDTYLGGSRLPHHCGGKCSRENAVCTRKQVTSIEKRSRLCWQQSLVIPLTLSRRYSFMCRPRRPDTMRWIQYASHNIVSDTLV